MGLWVVEGGVVVVQGIGSCWYGAGWLAQRSTALLCL